ncbi:hypothetical protein V497_06838 [Pseudogymnoascus sp. VKM F-4516 (FW-969)]|nr:hypothetical protein V497_06838 [Pseudogymnoascus sp. VKM F-4516 (FW-969)]
METIQRAASAATEALGFGEHGEHGENTHGTTNTTTRTDAAGERSHEPLSGRTGDTNIGEPYDAGNLDETSQQRIAASRGEPTTTTGTAGGYTSNTSNTGTGNTGNTGAYSTNTSTTGGAGGYVPASSTTTTGHSTSEGEPRRSSDISPRSGPAAGTIPIPSSIDRQSAGGGSYSSARETAARAMSSAETNPSSAGAGGAGTAVGAGAGAGAAAGGAGLWSAEKRAGDVGERDENGYKPGEEGSTGKGTKNAGKDVDETSRGGKTTKFAGEDRGEADAADATPSRAPAAAEGKKVKDAGEPGTGSTSTGSGAGAAGAAGAGAGAAGGDAEGAPMGRRESLTGHLPGVPGGEGLQKTSGGEGTGEQWVKSSGMKADGGDFDASAPGAGREADRLLTEKGITRTGADEKKVTGQMDTKAPENHGEGGLKDKIKNKLHKA